MRTHQYAVLGLTAALLLVGGGCASDDAQLSTRPAATSSETSDQASGDGLTAPSDFATQCASEMREVMTGGVWTLSQGGGSDLPSSYEVTIDGEAVFGGCGTDLAAREAGFMSWFYAHVGDEVLLFGEVPPGVSAVVINGETIEAQTRERSEVGLVALSLPSKTDALQSVRLEAVHVNGERTTLAPVSIDPTANTGFVIAFDQ